ncbi:MAG: hypothetical protein A2V85_02540 [Chloroflexi bacterium RBG_16_72_14]|nr:MAG: hypothetical protein A2V85_02540 [Chloroflexi bacterium RBG_16_72_14]
MGAALSTGAVGSGADGDGDGGTPVRSAGPVDGARSGGLEASPEQAPAMLRMATRTTARASLDRNIAISHTW